MRISDWSSDVCSSDLPAAFFLGQTPRHQLGRPALGEPVEDSLAQSIVAVQPGAGPAPGLGPGLRIGGLITDLGTGVALQLARDRRRLAIQSCSELPDRLPVFMKTGNRAAFRARTLTV